MGAHILHSTHHGAYRYWLCSDALRGDGPSRKHDQHTARCAVGTGGVWMRQSGSGARTAAPTSGRRGCRPASTSAVVDRDRDFDRRWCVVNHGAEAKLAAAKLWSRVYFVATF